MEPSGGALLGGEAEGDALEVWHLKEGMPPQLPLEPQGNLPAVPSLREAASCTSTRRRNGKALWQQLLLRQLHSVGPPRQQLAIIRCCRFCCCLAFCMLLLLRRAIGGRALLLGT